MKLKIEIAVRERDPWPAGGIGVVRRELITEITKAVAEVLELRNAELNTLSFVRPK